MKRRNFLALGAMAVAIAALPKTLFARPPKIDVLPIFKVTGINNQIGFQSCPQSVEANEHGYIVIPEAIREDFDSPYRAVLATSYALYAPMHGFERTGPWYLIRTISRREARRARFTIAAPDYEDGDLICKLCPSADPWQSHVTQEGFGGVGQHYTFRTGRTIKQS